MKLEKYEFHTPSIQFLGYCMVSKWIRERSITTWPTPTSIKGLQRCLGFANFYRRFIGGYSSLTSPLTSLLRGCPKSLTCKPSAESAFNQLKHAFTTAPVLAHPDPEKPFVVEVDASSVGVGAILSQQQGNLVAGESFLVSYSPTRRR